MSIPPKLDTLQKAVVSHSNKLWLPKGSDSPIIIGANEPYLTLAKNLESTNKIPDEVSRVRTRKLRIIVTEKQKLTLDKWFNACTGFYNVVNEFFKEMIDILRSHNEEIDKLKRQTTKKYLKLVEKRNQQIEHIKSFLKWTYTRDCFKNKRQQFEVEGIPAHTLDNVVKFICTAYKSSYTTHEDFCNFNVKNQKLNRNYKVMEFDYTNWNKDGFLFTKLGKLIVKDENKVIDLEQYRMKTCFIRYVKSLNHYNLLVILPWQAPQNTSELKIAGVDLGVRTFASVLSEAICYQEEVPEKIKRFVTKLDKIKRSDTLRNYKKRMLTLKYNRKIRHQVDQLHWEVINRLVKYFDNILVGNISAKQIASRSNNSYNNKMMYGLSYYKFRKRLEYKCFVHGKSMKIVDEAYTSKTCSNCSHFNPWLRAEKVLDCRNCGVSIDRDYNACRNIIFKCL